jgi:hypothetical protein
MSREYYAYWYRLDDKDSFLIWFSNENDGFVVDENGLIPSFVNLSGLQKYANEKQMDVDVENSELLNLDVVQSWLNNSEQKIADYNPFLNAWNLFEDISVSTNGNFDANKKLTKEIYNKIFWGCNIPAVTPEGKSYEPIWTKKELKIICETLDFGFQIFKEKIKT